MGTPTQVSLGNFGTATVRKIQSFFQLLALHGITWKMLPAMWSITRQGSRFRSWSKEREKKEAHFKKKLRIKAGGRGSRPI